MKQIFGKYKYLKYIYKNKKPTPINYF